MSSNAKPIVFYHYPCLDGFTAAWACWKAHPDWDYRPLKYGESLPDATGRDVYFIDVTVKSRVFAEWQMQYAPNSITVIDHHKTALEDLRGFAGPTVYDPAEIISRKVVFDMTKSGARLAWEFFHPGESVPAIVKYVEDRDLWRFNYRETKAINAFLFSFDYSFENWQYLEEIIDYDHERAIEVGDAILRKQAKDVEELAQIVTCTNIKGHHVPIINAPYFFASDICHKLANGYPFAASYFYDGARRKYIFSLRSTEEGIDVSEIAKQFGGGGHKHAAGFEIYDEGQELKSKLT